ncbi:tellurite resistance/C4-dicarboxylate transporter family protein [Micrococcus sp. TA1]|uniref:tellurite resistance/C4-dicarboxylate transporter family protein n=1 Tax=Micrococcus sp. TA1 TaxID=681627 RepID=UPI0016149D50|nr:tellurite resistance/C4-dicarboxylate transporter family protein [Micrococcus sp. TA1]MBB5749442.1 tellurite resistance protein TehA-like permease [Micrococcus sp. TA1]
MGTVTRSARRPPLSSSLRRFTPERLSPGYFAFVMGTGILSIGAAQRGWDRFSAALIVLAAVGYAVLVVLNGWRLLAYRGAYAADFHDSARAFLVFTFVAATDVLAASLAGIGIIGPAAALLVVGSVSWLLLGYAVPWAAVLGRSERPVTAAANGTWFIWVVAAQSVAVVAATLEPELAEMRQGLAMLAVFAWSVGLVLYVAVAILVVYRMLAYPLEPEQFQPPYWVSMGAIAITIVAGARIVEMESTPMVDAVRGLVAGAAVVLWCFATWLIPVLFAAGVWRHVLKKVPLRYTPTLWSIVFPLGMYAVAGMYLGRADQLPIVARIGELWVWVALAAWAATTLAMVGSWVRVVRVARREVTR